MVNHAGRHEIPRERRSPWVVLSDLLRDSLKQVVVALVVLVLGSVAAKLGWDAWFDQPSIAEQLEEIKSDVAAGKGEVINTSDPLDLHGTGIKSYLLQVRHHGISQDEPVADELRIYDANDGELDLRFKFAPIFLDSFAIRAIVDADRDDKRDIFAAYTPISEDLRYEYPVIISWNDSTQQYEISPVLKKRFRLTEVDSDKLGFPIDEIRKRYSSRGTLRDPEANGEPIKIRAFPVDFFDIEQITGQSTMFATFLQQGSFFEDPSLPVFLEVRAWVFYDNEARPPKAYPCRGRVTVKLSDDSRFDDFIEAWTAEEDNFC
jgi:hypothetical protein